MTRTAPLPSIGEALTALCILPIAQPPLPEEPAAGYLRPAPGLVVVSADGLTHTYTANDDTPSVPLVALTTLVTGSGRSLPVPSACFTVDAVNGRAPGSTEVVTPRDGSNLWRVPHFFAVEYGNTHSFVRIVNLSATNSIFTVRAYDETGSDRFMPLRIRVAAESAAAFNSRDLEFNEQDKFLDGEYVANGRGNWRLDITPSTSTPIDNTQYYVGAYARTEGDFLTNMGEYARAIPNGDDLVRPNLYVLPSFNPAGNRTKVSNLRLSNLTDSATGNFALVAISDQGLFRAARLLEMPAGGHAHVDRRGSRGDARGRQHLRQADLHHRRAGSLGDAFDALQGCGGTAPPVCGPT